MDRKIDQNMALQLSRNDASTVPKAAAPRPVEVKDAYLHNLSPDQMASTTLTENKKRTLSKMQTPLVPRPVVGETHFIPSAAENIRRGVNADHDAAMNKVLEALKKDTQAIGVKSDQINAISYMLSNELAIAKETKDSAAASTENTPITQDTLSKIKESVDKAKASVSDGIWNIIKNFFSPSDRKLSKNIDKMSIVINKQLDDINTARDVPIREGTATILGNRGVPMRKIK